MRLYHNPRCSKSRQALSIMKESGVDFEEYRYLDLGIDPEDLDVLSSLNNVIRTSELDHDTMVDLTSKTEVIVLLKNHPRLLQRPILVHGNKAVIGRPPEDIIILLHEA